MESNINKLLDLVQEDVRASHGDDSTVRAIEELRSNSPMSDKIAVANRALPNHLKANGVNPLGRLYQVLSEGIHSLSDTECLEKAKAISECLAFLVSELVSRKANQTRFKNKIGGL